MTKADATFIITAGATARAKEFASLGFDPITSTDISIKMKNDFLATAKPPTKERRAESTKEH
jgi:hypothetical protein